MSGPKSALSGFEKLNAVVSIYRPSADQPPPRTTAAITSTSTTTTTTASITVPSPSTSEATPAAATAAPASSSPRLILLFTWLGATPRAVSKYTSGLQALYPRATIYLASSPFSAYATSTASQQRTQLAPIVSALQDEQKQQERQQQQQQQQQRERAKANADDAGVLVLSLSNSGAYKLALLGAELRGARATVTVLDSAPGRMTLRSGLNAMSQALPRSPLFYYPTWLLLAAAGAATVGFYAISGVEDALAWVRRAINDEADTDAVVVGKGGGGGIRVYVYSEQDAIVPAADVIGHAEEARRRGWDVRLERFEGSQHCAHLRANETRYWKVVEQAWDRGSLL